MSSKKILTIPDPVLRKKSDPVDLVDKKIKKLMDDMLETMYDAPGIGLAAIQIGVAKRVVVMDLSKENAKKSPLFFVNPKITWKSNVNAAYEEGCLSIPNQFAMIERPDKVKIKYLSAIVVSAYRLQRLQPVLAVPVKYQKRLELRKQ